MSNYRNSFFVLDVERFTTGYQFFYWNPTADIGKGNNSEKKTIKPIESRFSILLFRREVGSDATKIWTNFLPYY